jgi:polysaccharide export outer membrane protein
MRRILFLLILVSLTGCSNTHFNYPVLGADEFVTDSYLIREGKLSILEMSGRELDPLPKDAMDEYEDTVYEDDILNVAVFHPSRVDLIDTINSLNKTIGFRVINGKITIPDLGSVEIAGLTLTEAKNHIQALYQEQIQDLEVFLDYKDRLSKKVDLTGMVATTYLPVDGKIRLYEVLAKARVPNNANLFMSYVVRDGKPLAVDLHRLRNQGDISRNIVMRGGDKIYIANPMESMVMVMGEVGAPQGVPVGSGSVSLRQALVAARGIPYSGDRQAIQVIRGNLLKPKIYLLSWEHIINLPNDSLLLMPGDTVYVSEKPITKWNRFISQLFPSFQGLNVGHRAYNLLGGN